MRNYIPYTCICVTYYQPKSSNYQLTSPLTTPFNSQCHNHPILSRTFNIYTHTCTPPRLTLKGYMRTRKTILI